MPLGLKTWELLFELVGDAFVTTIITYPTNREPNEFTDIGFTIDDACVRSWVHSSGTSTHPRRPGKRFARGSGLVYWNQAGLDEHGEPDNPNGYVPVEIYFEM